MEHLISESPQWAGSEEILLRGNCRVYRHIWLWPFALTDLIKYSLDDTYTRMLPEAHTNHWSSQTPNDALYGDISAVSSTIATRRSLLLQYRAQSTTICAIWARCKGQRSRDNQKQPTSTPWRETQGPTNYRISCQAHCDDTLEPSSQCSASLKPSHVLKCLYPKMITEWELVIAEQIHGKECRESTWREVC